MEWIYIFLYKQEINVKNCKSSSQSLLLCKMYCYYIQTEIYPLNKF